MKFYLRIYFPAILTQLEYIFKQKLNYSIKFERFVRISEQQLQYIQSI